MNKIFPYFLALLLLSFALNVQAQELSLKQKQLIELLPTKKQKLVSEAIERILLINENTKEQMQNSLSKMKSTMLSDTFNDKIYLEAAKQAQEIRSKKHAQSIAIIANAAKQLDKSERYIFVQILNTN